MESIREVTTDEGREFARRNKIEFIETSVKSGSNVKSAMMDLARLINIKQKQRRESTARRELQRLTVAQSSSTNNRKCKYC